jgi:collagen type VII alpha
VAVAFDAVGPSSAGAGNVGPTTLSWTHTTVAATTSIVVGCALDVAADGGFSMTCKCDGVLMTSIAVVHSNGGTSGFLQAWRIDGISSGAHTILITSSGGTISDLEGGSISFSGAGAYGTAVTATGSSTTPSVAVASNTNGNLIAGFAAGGDNINSATSPSTSRFIINNRGSAGNSVGNAAGSTTPATGSSVTVAWAANTSPWAVIAIEIKPGAVVLPLAVTQGTQQYAVPPPSPPSRIIMQPGKVNAFAALSGSGTLTVAAPGVGGPLPVVISARQYYAVPPPSPPSQLVRVLQPITAATAALSGSGTLTVAAPGIGNVPPVTAAQQYYAKAPPSPPSQIVGVLQPVTAAAASLSGSGTLTVAPPGIGGPIPAIIAAPVQYARPSPSPPSQIVAFTSAAFAGSAALSGSGTLTAGPVFAGAAALTGSGTLTVAAPGVGGPIPAVVAAPVQYAKPQPSPPSQIVAFTSAVFAGSASLSGSGTLTAGPVFAAAAALSGSGTLTAGFTVGIIPPVVQGGGQAPRLAPQPGSRIIGAATFAAVGAASLSGSGTLTASPILVAVVVLSGTGTLTGARTVILQVSYGTARTGSAADTASTGDTTPRARAGSGGATGSTGGHGAGGRTGGGR